MERFFHQLIKVQGLSLRMKDVTVRRIGAGVQYKVERAKDWSDLTELCGPQDNVMTHELSDDVSGCYYQPLSLFHPLYDALIIPATRNEQVGVLQITVGLKHSIKFEWFGRLFEWRPQNVPTKRNNWNIDFKFLMIRVAANIFEVKRMMLETFHWQFDGSTKVVGFPERIAWSECIFDMEEALKKYWQSKHIPVNSASVEGPAVSNRPRTVTQQRQREEQEEPGTVISGTQQPRRSPRKRAQKGLK
jgi:hypothetical protein